MIRQRVSADSMSVLFHEDGGIEPQPEPFRGQPDVVFYVPFSEYEKYVLSLSYENNIILATELSVLHDLAAKHTPKFVNKYALDMSYAIGKEIFISENFKREATVILPQVQTPAHITLSDYLFYADIFSNYYQAYFNWLLSTNIPRPMQWTGHNEKLFNLGLIFFGLVQDDQNVCIPNITYNL